MIPILYESTEVDFTSNGLGRLYDCSRCEVTEERNEIYECEFDYPVGGVNYGLLKCGRIIAVEHGEGNDIQPFDIYSHSKPLDGVVTFHARHISYRLKFVTVTGSNINSLAAALNLFASATPASRFEFRTDKTSTGVMSAADGLPKTVRQLMGGEEGSVLDAYGGEYEYDKFTVNLWEARGEQRPLTIRYGVNMTSYEEDMDYSESYTAVKPYWASGSDKVIGDMVTADLPAYDGRVSCVPLDISDKFSSKPTKAQVEAEARKYLTANTPNAPSQTIKVSFVKLADSDEYGKFAGLQECQLCDYVNVVFPMYDMIGSYEIVKVVWDVLLERYTEIELGNLSISLAQALGI